MGRNLEPEDDDRRVEIIPPGEESHASSRIWIARGQNVKIVKLGPFGSLVMAFAIGLILLFGLFFLTSAFLILIPVAALLAGGAYLSGLIGNPFKRLR